MKRTIKFLSLLVNRVVIKPIVEMWECDKWISITLYWGAGSILGIILMVFHFGDWRYGVVATVPTALFGIYAVCCIVVAGLKYLSTAAQEEWKRAEEVTTEQKQDKDVLVRGSDDPGSELLRAGM